MTEDAKDKVKTTTSDFGQGSDKGILSKQKRVNMFTL